MNGNLGIGIWYVLAMAMICWMSTESGLRRTYEWRMSQQPPLRKLLMPGRLSEFAVWKRTQRILLAIAAVFFTAIFVAVIGQHP
jgi:hypothetical protein